MTNKAFHLVKPVVRGGVEPPTFRLSGAFAASLHVAGCGLMGDLAAQTVAGCRLMWPDICGRWLPVWLPELTEGAAIAAWQVIGTVQVAHHRHGGHDGNKITVGIEDDLDGGPADKTVRFGSTAPSMRLTCAPRTPLRSAASSPRSSNTPAGLGRTTASRGRSADIRASTKDPGMSRASRTSSVCR
jgi:hypothetical protein